jgi:hypothetical protein
MGAPRVTREAAIRAMQAAAGPDGVAVTSREWKLQRRQPGVNAMMRHFPGKWAELCDAAGLVSPRAALDQARRDAKRSARERLAREGREPPQPESFKARRVRERGESKRAQMLEDIRAGTLRVRMATEAERQKWAEEREARAAKYVPNEDELRVPGAPVKRTPDPPADADVEEAAA